MRLAGDLVPNVTVRRREPAACVAVSGATGMIGGGPRTRLGTLLDRRGFDGSPVSVCVLLVVFGRKSGGLLSMTSHRLSGFQRSARVVMASVSSSANAARMASSESFSCAAALTSSVGTSTRLAVVDSSSSLV